MFVSFKLLDLNLGLFCTFSLPVGTHSSDAPMGTEGPGDKSSSKPVSGVKGWVECLEPEEALELLALRAAWANMLKYTRNGL